MDQSVARAIEAAAASEIVAGEAQAINRPISDNPTFHSDILTGLSARPRVISPRWFYDRRGSELFELITGLPEYYPTRTERRLLEQHGREISRLTAGGRVVVEFGSGSSSKTPLLLTAVSASGYVPIDISGEFLQASAKAVAERFPRMTVAPVEADFNAVVRIPRSVGTAPRLGFFPGSTIGNCSPLEAVDLLRRMSRTLGADSMLLIGIDRIKDERLLVPAYDDSQGITAEFNLNVLHRINSELGADVPVEDFRHIARWNETEARIEMHLEAKRNVAFNIGQTPFQMKAGETIHTESSYKYDLRGARLLLRAGGWAPVAHWTDTEDLFMVILAEAAAA
jgi:dimethylhistidine N-methyltransferase